MSQNTSVILTPASISIENNLEIQAAIAFLSAQAVWRNFGDITAVYEYCAVHAKISKKSVKLKPYMLSTTVTSGHLVLEGYDEQQESYFYILYDTDSKLVPQYVYTWEVSDDSFILDYTHYAEILRSKPVFQ